MSIQDAWQPIPYLGEATEGVSLTPWGIACYNHSNMSGGCGQSELRRQALLSKMSFVSIVVVLFYFQEEIHVFHCCL